MWQNEFGRKRNMDEARQGLSSSGGKDWRCPESARAGHLKTYRVEGNEGLMAECRIKTSSCRPRPESRVQEILHSSSEKRSPSETEDWKSGGDRDESFRRLAYNRGHQTEGRRSSGLNARRGKYKRSSKPPPELQPGLTVRAPT